MVKHWKTKRWSQDLLELTAVGELKTNQPFWILLISDVHFDSVDCNRKLLRQHLDQALDRNATILSFGDFFDAMQGKYDPRKSYKGLRPEYVKDVHVDTCYLDDIVDDAVKFLTPYSANLKMMSDGNHEDEIKKRLQTDLTQRTIAALQQQTREKIYYGHGSGVVKIKLAPTNVKHKQIAAGPLLGYDHGEGLKAPIAKERWLRDRPDVDIMVSGHYHSGAIQPVGVIRYGSTGEKYTQKRMIISLPGYKDEGGARSGWARKTKAVRPTVCGGVWLRFEYHRTSKSIRYTAHETEEYR